jgi:hypothetical protein
MKVTPVIVNGPSLDERDEGLLELAIVLLVLTKQFRSIGINRVGVG